MRIYLNKKELNSIDNWKNAPKSLKLKIIERKGKNRKEFLKGEEKISEYEYFLLNKVKFLDDSKTKGKFIAIFEKEIIGVSDEKLSLIKEISKKKWSHPPFIIKVQEELPTVTMITPF